MKNKKKGFGLTEILMVIVILTILYIYAGNQASSKFQSSKDIAEVNWLTDLFPKSIFYARQELGRDSVTKELNAYNTITTAQLQGAGANAKTGAGRDWSICDPKPTTTTELCIEITELSTSKMARLKSLIEQNANSYIKTPLEEAVDYKIQVIYDFTN